MMHLPSAGSVPLKNVAISPGFDDLKPPFVAERRQIWRHQLVRSAQFPLGVI
jgi:hypothetical protein